MTGGLYLIVWFILIFLDIVSLAMLGRAILSWFPTDGPTRLGSFLYVITEPFIIPVRALCNRFGWFQGLPLDMPFLLTMVTLSMVSFILQSSL
ncbi:MAG: YggT family protein [Clostridia bacterium]|nr:YggT family protein [Clostridia bacterium]